MLVWFVHYLDSTVVCYIQWGNHLFWMLALCHRQLTACHAGTMWSSSHKTQLETIILGFPKEWELLHKEICRVTRNYKSKKRQGKCFLLQIEADQLAGGGEGRTAGTCVTKSFLVLLQKGNRKEKVFPLLLFYASFLSSAANGRRQGKHFNTISHFPR